MLQKDIPDHHDAELIIKLYDLRREPMMRESRSAMYNKYWPRSAEEAVEVLRPDHPLNTPFRQTTGYWEMVFGMAHHGIVHADYLVENSGEGIFLFARAEPYIEAIRAAASRRTLKHTEWAATSTDMGRTLLEHFRARVAKALASHAS